MNLLTTNDLAKLTGYSVNYLREYKKLGIPHTIVGNRPLFNRADVQAWLKQHKAKVAK